MKLFVIGMGKGKVRRLTTITYLYILRTSVTKYKNINEIQGSVETYIGTIMVSYNSFEMLDKFQKIHTVIYL